MELRWLVVFWHLVIAKGWWCQASHGSCVGQRHKFQEDATFKTNVRPLLSGHGHNLRFADWDSDGDVDVLLAENDSLWFYERLPGDAFEKHKLMTHHLSKWDGFEVADWDGDRRSVVLAGVTHIREHPAILQTTVSYLTACNMQAVDFDEDGDLDLVMGLGPPSPTSTEELVEWLESPRRKFSELSFERYFERVLDELEERTGEQNPLQAFPDQVDWIADLDGDGRLDVLVAVRNSANDILRWRYFRRTAAGTFVEPWENPLAEIQPSSQKIHVADWNSDGLPDVLRLVGTRVWSYYQHVVDRDLRHNSHFKMYEDIHLSPGSSFVVQDWNEDGFEDVMVVQPQSVPIPIRRWRRVWKLRRYEFQPRHMKEVLGFSLNVNSTVVPAYDHHVDELYLSGFALVDWDRDGALDLLIASEIDGKLHFYPNLGEESAEHPFKNIQLKKQPDQDRTIWIFAKPMVVDWDNDGDFDLFLGPPDGRYFEHSADGSLREKQSPLVSAMHSLPPNSYDRRRRAVDARNWQFVDCDADGDLDLIQIPDSKAPAQACEHDDGTHELRCDPDFLCLGSDVSQYQGGAADGGSFFSVLDGQLKLFVQRASAQSGIELWTPGFCVPSELCNNKGHCLPGKSHCRCNLGHDQLDCSSCHEHFYSVLREELQVQDCKACPGDVAGGKAMAHATALKHIFMEQMRTAEVHAWTAIAQLAQRRLMETAVLVLADPFPLPEAFAKNVELESFPAGEAPTVQVVLQEKFQGHGAVQLVNSVQPEPTKVRINSATYAREVKFQSQAVQPAAHVMRGVSPKMVWCVKHVRMEPFLLTAAVSVTAVPLVSIRTQAETFVSNALQEQSQRFQAALHVSHVQQALMHSKPVQTATCAHEALFPKKAARLAVHVRLDVLPESPGRVNDVLVEPFLKKEAVSVAAVPLETILGQEAAAVPNVRQEQSHRLQAAVRVKFAVPERMKLTGKSVTHAHKAKFLQWQAVQLAAHVMLAVLQKRP
ncbi:unnamed protein product [Cladocopium goreaui]|uniref:Extracellular matrix protein FRAS1 n=1 Tax=Cladocopium goreaui TaxID=2562237 RepID=A0A9P1DT38_9DINO|nr:unnamed protein product [Cladocopium goreaui]